MIEYGEPNSGMWRTGEGWRGRVSHVCEFVQVRGLSSFLVHVQAAIHPIKARHGFSRNIHKHRIEETHLPFIQFLMSILSDIKPNGLYLWALAC